MEGTEIFLLPADPADHFFAVVRHGTLDTIRELADKSPKKATPLSLNIHQI